MIRVNFTDVSILSITQSFILLVFQENYVNIL